MIPALPARLATANVPRLFTPTALASSAGCRLRLVLQSAPQNLASLSSGPAAALGTLAHRYISLCGSPAGTGARLFDRLHRTLAGELATDKGTAHYADLPRVIGLSAWSRFRFELIGRSDSDLMPTPGLRKSKATGSIFGRERPLVSQRLRLKGRADRVSRLPDGTIEIRDHKTGDVLGSEGDILPSIAIQLRSYGLVILERFADSAVRLIVDAGSEHEVTFSATDQRRLRRFLAKIDRDLPSGQTLVASDLASPGEACATCAFRHRCDAYLHAAPRWWQATAPVPAVVPRDTWGEVFAFSTGIEGMFDIAIVDAAGRRVRLDRLDPLRWTTPPRIGDRLWAFNLESPISRARARAAKLHPTTFHECPADSTQQRAWGLQLFSA